MEHAVPNSEPDIDYPEDALRTPPRLIKQETFGTPCTGGKLSRSATVGRIQKTSAFSKLSIMKPTAAEQSEVGNVAWPSAQKDSPTFDLRASTAKKQGPRMTALPLQNLSGTAAVQDSA